MAQKVHVELVDDVDGTPAAETVTFGLDGRVYEIDLSARNADKLRTTLTRFVENGRKVAGTKRRTTGTNGNTKAVREWAREQGYEVSNRGQIPNNVKEAYDLAHA